MGEDPYDEMGRTWLGMGNLSGKYWFCGLEPGGTDRPDWPHVWATLYGKSEVIDPHDDPSDPDYAALFGPTAPAQKTWIQLIRVVRSFAGESTDDVSCLSYQRQRFLSGSGDVALLELSAYAAKGLETQSPRSRYLEERVRRISQLVLEYKPLFVVCYGRTAKAGFEKILGGPFDDRGLGYLGSTIVALVSHPTDFYHGVTAKTFVDLGLFLRSETGSSTTF